MNRHVREFFHRGLLFGGFGPLIAGVIDCLLEQTVPDFSLSGTQVCIAVFTTYALAFVQAGASVFHQIEHWSVAKALLCHFAVTYAAYVLCYLANAWIAFEWGVLLIFTAVFIGGYILVQLIANAIAHCVSSRLNRSLH